MPRCWLAALLIVAAGGLSVFGTAPRASASPPSPANAGSPALSQAIRQQLDKLPDRSLAFFYRQREYAPLWIGPDGLRPEGRVLIATLAGARADGLDPAQFGVQALQAAANRHDRRADATLEIALSAALADFARALRRSTPAMIYVEPLVRPATPRTEDVLAQAAAAPSLSAYLAAVMRVNPVYDRLRAAYAAELALGTVPRDRMARIDANLERARALPPQLGDRHALVNTATAMLTLVQDGRDTDAMRVVVGKASMPTPMMAASIGFVIANPYWNLPPDLMAQRAATIEREGPGLLKQQQLELLSDWTPSARRLIASEIDWHDVASGAVKLRARQLPGPRNMMGRIKFMLPNRLGIYLHDTPDKAAFTRTDRRLSSGCVRVEDATRLARWLFRGTMPAPDGTAEQRIDMPAPVPVYITYLTAVVRGGRIALLPDIYGRDMPPRVVQRASNPWIEARFNP